MLRYYIGEQRPLHDYTYEASDFKLTRISKAVYENWIINDGYVEDWSLEQSLEQIAENTELAEFYGENTYHMMDFPELLVIRKY